MCNVNVNDDYVQGFNTVNVNIFRRSIPALVDTGAAITVAPFRLISEIPQLNNCKIYPAKFNAVKLADGREIAIKGVINVRV